MRAKERKVIAYNVYNFIINEKNATIMCGRIVNLFKFSFEEGEIWNILRKYICFQ